MVLSKKVAIIGGGASGIAAAKAIIEVGLSPTVFESTKCIGGMWNPKTKRCWRSLKTNLSKFTCVFSDFAWKEDDPIFPSQEEFNDYLQRYAEHFIPKQNFQLGCKVNQVIQKDDGTFELEWSDDDRKQHKSIFDNVIVSTGFFSSPIMPKIKNLEKFQGKISHSSEYSDPFLYKDKTVAVVGSSFSAIEIASEIAFFTSKVINISPRTPWVIPRFIPVEPNNPNSHFLPLDMVFYKTENVKNHIELNTEETQKIEKMEKYKKSNNYMRALIGGTDHDVFNPFKIGNRINTDLDCLPPYVAISDIFTKLVKMGKIEIIHGYLHEITHDGKLEITKQSETDNQNTYKAEETLFTKEKENYMKLLNEIEEFIFCTGFHPHLDFLHEDLLRPAGHEPHEAFLPLLLYKGFLHPTVRNLAFVGMYRGPYFGVIELQARLAAAIFSGSISEPTTEKIEKDLEASRRIRENIPREQFPFGDYVALMTDLYAELNENVKKEEIKNDVKENMEVEENNIIKEGEKKVLIPAQFQIDYNITEFGDNAVKTFSEKCENGFLIASIIHQNLMGNWSFIRELTSFSKMAPSGVVKGNLSFEPMIPENDLFNPSNLGFLYNEQGKFYTENGAIFDISAQKYIYEYNKEKDTLDIFFPLLNETSTKNTSIEKGNPFVSLKFKKDNFGWVGEDIHLCGEDTYKALFRFGFVGCVLGKFEIEFRVTGPTKDYLSKTVFEMK